MAADDSRRNLSSDTGEGLWWWTGGEAGLNIYFLLVILGTKKIENKDLIKRGGHVSNFIGAI